MKIIWISIVSVLVAVSSFAQDSLNMNQLGYLSWPENVSDVRGAALNGHEYALLGSHSGLSIVDVTDPATMAEVAWFDGAASIWRDPFYYNEHAFCVTEGGGGMLVVDMSGLPGNTNLPFTFYSGINQPFSSAHNMFIDENGIAYIFGANTIGGVIMLDVSQDPMNPVELGVWNDEYVHDGFVRGDTLWASCLASGAFAVDVTDKANPTTMVSWPTVGNFCHNMWPSDDGNYVFTTDELGSGYVAAYDVSDFDNIVEVDRLNHPLSEGVIPHNTHYVNGWLVTSHYKDGVVVYDAHQPDNMIMTGYYDPNPLSGGGFSGCWGVWPFLPSGNILMSDIELGLYVVGHQYVQAAYLEGNVTEVVTGIPLSGVDVDIVSVNLPTETDIFGDYVSGTATAGLYDITFQRAGYVSQTIEDVQLLNGETAVVDVELVPDVPFVFVGQVVDATTGNPISGGSVGVENNFFQISETSDANGVIIDSTFYAGVYSVTVGVWGYEMFCEDVNIESNGDTVVFELAAGYEDNFSLDLGWTISGNATAGVWERGLPIATEFNGETANPGSDSEDCGALAFVTGNGGGAAGDDDIDNGFTRLTSPSMNLSSYVHPFVEFDYWFFNDGGNSTPNDNLTISISNGDSTITRAVLSTTDGEWTAGSFILETAIGITSDMTVIIESADDEPGHLVEAGFDNFRILDVPNLAVEESNATSAFKMYPNPVSANNFIVELDANSKATHLNVLDLTGRIVYQNNQLYPGKNVIPTITESGIYLVEVVGSNLREIKRLVIQH